MNTLTPETDAIMQTPMTQTERLDALILKCRELEICKTHYALALQEFIDEATDFSNTRHGFLRFLRLADKYEEMFQEFTRETSPNHSSDNA
jgi:hypothetical protein